VNLARAGAALFCVTVAIGACSKSPRVESRSVTLHAPAACAPAASALGVFAALGDFQPPATLPPLPLADVGEQLAGAPADTQEIEVNVDETAWLAHTLVAASGDVDTLLLPFQSPCALTDPVTARTGEAVGAIDENHVLVAGGAPTGSSGVPATMLVDLSVGAVSALPAGLLVPRVQTTVTSWAGGGVVAGGVRPGTGDAGAAQASAEVYVSSVGDFDGQLIVLSEPRAQHGAVTLANGQTLLVGGVDGSGNVLASMELVDASSHRAQTTNLASLAVARANPTVLVLASGEILVAGGVDGAGAPVGMLEWFKGDGSAASGDPLALVASSNEAFVRLDAGGALAVIGPDTTTTPAQNVWVVSAAHAIEAASSIQGGLSAVQLFDGADQAPALWTGDRWLLWNPWSGSFATPIAIGAVGPSVGDPVASPEPGLGLWLDGKVVSALRFAARGPYASTVTALLTMTTDTSHTGPDQLVTGGPGAIVFDPTSGLSLQTGASVFVTDATFASFTLDAQTPTGAPPALVLRDSAGNTTLLDATACAIPASSSIHFERDGATVRASSGTGPLVTCSIGPAADARVAIGVQGQGSGVSVVQDVAIARQ
jgi:hypothetical protein